MDNDVKLIVTIHGIPGGILKRTRTEAAEYRVRKKELYSNYKGKDADKVILKGTYTKNIYECPEVSQTIRMTRDAYEYMTTTRPPWLSKNEKFYGLSKRQKLEVHLQRTCEQFNGTSFEYSIMDD